MTASNAPGAPGSEPHWTTSAKSGVGTAAGSNSRVWFTISHGIVNEVFYPSIDVANTRDLGLIVVDDNGFFSEEKRHTTHEIRPIAPGVPGYVLTNTCRSNRYRTTKTVLTDPDRDVLLQHIQFEALTGDISDYRLYVLLAPHIKNKGSENTAWLGDYKGARTLYACRDDVSLALACSEPWLNRSVGYVGRSDGWQQLHDHGTLTDEYERAENGNVALTGQVDLAKTKGKFVVALGLGKESSDAAQQAHASLLADFGNIKQQYTDGWLEYQSSVVTVDKTEKNGFPLFRHSAAILKVHQAKQVKGGLIASLSVPWGNERSDSDVAGYHIVWPRDQVQAAGALLASGDATGARDTLAYLVSTQEADGHWPQNMWLNGDAYWPGIQADETAFVILLAGYLRSRNELSNMDPWPVVSRAASFLVTHGPASDQDRWEENEGYSPFTIATEISALLIAADIAEENGKQQTAVYLRETADAWNERIEDWTYVTNTELSREVGVEGYYIRIAPREAGNNTDAKYGSITLKNKPEGSGQFPAWSVVSPDFLALVRFGLRDPHDQKILNTLAVIDAKLKVETSAGPVWHRYSEDGYGEAEDGSAFNGIGIGRGWPLLVGERAHYELAAGNLDSANQLMAVMAAMSGDGALFPEQVWDSADIPDRMLYNGKPSGSAMPLVWAHAEYIKLSRSLHDGAIFDTPLQALTRYRSGIPESKFLVWRFSQQIASIPAGKSVRIEVLAAACIKWTADAWITSNEQMTTDTELGIYSADISTDGLSPGQSVEFTFFWVAGDKWEGKTYSVLIQ